MSTFMTYNTSRQIATIETSVMFFDSLITSGTANFYTSLQLHKSHNFMAGPSAHRNLTQGERRY